MLRYQLEHREPTTMVTLVLIGMVTLILASTGLWREIIPGFG